MEERVLLLYKLVSVSTMYDGNLKLNQHRKLMLIGTIAINECKALFDRADFRKSCLCL